MFRELTPKEAFQNHCLAQMGITSWLSSPDGASGTVFMPLQAWQTSAHTQSDFGPTIAEKETPSASGFDATPPEPVSQMLPEEKEQSVNHLREQLNAGPEIIVEDLQPIEELAVNIDVEPDSTELTRITHLTIRAYALSNRLLILSDVPHVFSQEEEVERLALKMGQALLKQSIDEWQSSGFSWPNGLKNPYFLSRTDWLLGAIESYVARLIADFPEPPWLVLAGGTVSQLVDDLPDDSLLKTYPMARIVSLSELHRIPELRKEAWETMQSCFYNRS